MAGGGVRRLPTAAAASAPGRLEQQAAYSSCVYCARVRKVSRFVSSTPATMWSCHHSADVVRGAAKVTAKQRGVSLMQMQET